jgi:hypothetical protein
LLALALAVAAVLILVPSAGAARLTELGQFAGEPGSGAGQIASSGGIAVNATGAGGVAPGEIYLADGSNNRVDEFTKNGDFVRAWGKDVNPAEPGEGFEICTAASGCQRGVPSAEAGALNIPSTIAVDQQTGNVYVGYVAGISGRVNVFSPEGEFEGAFGYGVDAAAPATELQFCTTATGCNEGEAASAAGGFAVIGAIAVDPTNGNVWIGDRENHRLSEYEMSLNAQDEVIGVSFVHAIGWHIDASAPAEELQQCTTATGCQEGKVGTGAGQIDATVALAVDSAGDLYAASVSGLGRPCLAGTPCRVMKFSANGTSAEEFGPSAGGATKCQLNWNSGGNANDQSVAGIAVDPGDQHVFFLLKATEESYEICDFTGEGELTQISPAEPVPTAGHGGNQELGLALGPEQRADVSAPNLNRTAWPVSVFGVIPAAPAALLPTTELTSSSATFNGEVTTPQPGGFGFAVRYRFEYSADNGSTWITTPALTASSTAGPHPVQQKVSGLLANATYRLRLVTITSVTTTSEEQSFKTPIGPPVISEVRALDADQTSAKIEAQVSPNGSPTSYRFEWGPTTAYGNVLPTEFEPSLGSGHEASQVVARLGGLTPGATYHYRVVAHNAGGTTVSADQLVETLNSCGLPEGRCFELVSRREAGPVAVPGQYPAQAELHFQVSSEPGALAYTVEGGYPDATSGGEVLDLARRGSDGWISTQLGVPLISRNESNGATSHTGKTLAISEDLSCSVSEAAQLLTDSPSARILAEVGGASLYRGNPDGSYTLITGILAENLDDFDAVDSSYEFGGISQDCGKAVFASRLRFPGVPGVETGNRAVLYEWDEGTLRSVGYVPGPGGEVPVGATLGVPAGVNFLSEADYWNAVSDDGSRVFFSAERQQSNHPEDVGKRGLFVRENGTTTRDLSLSETANPAGAATYQMATADGSRVFFTANAGLTSDSSPRGEDLYEYNLEKEPSEHPLTDLSVAPESADVVGVMGASRDGSHVYFVAKGQLVPGKGKSTAENQADGTFSIYSVSEGTVTYIGGITARDLESGAIIGSESSTSQVTPDGRYLLFESRADVTGYQSGAIADAGAGEVYLYDAEASSEPTVCVSCRQDGQPSVTPVIDQVLQPGAPVNPFAQTRFLTLNGGSPVAYFVSDDVLAKGAVEGLKNLYQWSHGQIFRIATEPPGLRGEQTGDQVSFVGSGANGVDAYFSTPEPLNWEDGDGRSSIYDARIGGGFPQPPAPAAPCDPTVEGSCSTAQPQPPSASTPASTNFSGPGNVKAKSESQKKKHKKTKKHKKKKQKKSHRQKKKSHKKSKTQNAKGNRGAGK